MLPGCVGGCQEGQDMAGAELGKRCKEEQEGLLQVCQPEKKG